MLNQFNASIWGDEGFSAILSMHSLPDIIKIIINDTSPPLWNISEWFVFHTLGTAEVYIRLLAFFYFLIAIFFTYKIGRFLWDRNTGLVAALLTFLNPFFFTYAFEGRMYSIMAAGVAGSMYFFLTFLFGKEKSAKEKRLRLAGYVLMTLWALYSHHFAMFAIMVQGMWFLYLLATRNKAVKPLFIGFIGIALGYLPWVFPLYHQVKMVGGGFWLGKPKLVDLFAIIMQYLAYGIKHALAFPAIVIVLATLGLRKWNENIKKSLFLMSWFLIPIIATFVISQIFQSIFFNRYLLYTIPGAMLLLASSRRSFSKISIAVVVMLFVIIDVFYFFNPIKLPYRDMASYVKETKMSSDYLINWNSNGTHHIWETKYYGLDAPIYIPGKGELPYFVGTALMEKSDVVNELPKNVKRIGVVTTGPIEEITLPGYTENVRKTWGDLKFIWFQKTR